MGMKLKRLKGGSKGKKWKHGQSCLSNPAVGKFRERAKLGFFEKIENSNLTQDALAKHSSDLKSVSGVARAASVHSFALSTDGTATPSVLSVPKSLTSAKISIGYNPPSEAAKTVLDLQKEMEDMAINPEDDLKSQAKTFATRYTTCSIPAFENFFNKLSIQSEHQVMMLSFHATIQDVIKEKNLPETPSSYFVAIIMSLEGMLEDKDRIAAGLALLVRVIKTVPLRVLRTKCDTFGTTLNTIITKFQDSDNVQLLSHALGCLSILLRAQHLARWYENDTVKTWLKNILVFTLHTQPKVRKSGQYNVSAVLKGSQFMVTSPLRSTGDDDFLALPHEDDDTMEDGFETRLRAEDGDEQHKGSNTMLNDDDLEHLDKPLEIHPAAELVADFLIGQLKLNSSLSSSNKTVLHMLVFTRQVIMALPKHKLQTVIQRLVSLVGLGTGLVNTAVMQALHALCNARPPCAVLPLTLVTHLLGVLTKHTPGVSSALIAPAHDPVAVKSWSSVVTAALLRALELDAEQSIKWTWEWCSVALKYWRSDNVQVLLAMEESVSSVLTAVYDLVTVETSSQYETAVRQIMQQLELGLSYQCQGAWPCIFRLLGQCFSELGLYYAPTMIPALKHLCELMANNSLASVGELEKAIGKAVQGLGVEAVVCSAPFDITGDITKDEKNLWLLPLLRKFVKGSRLIFFKDNFVPLAEKCFNVRAKLESEPEPNARLVTLYKTVEYQIWAMLPSFACEAVDVEAAQTNRAFAKLVCRLIEHSESSRIDAMAALRNMIAADGSSTGRIAKNSSNYLPALFNLFVREPKTSHNADKPDIIDPSHRLAALSTIIAYLKIVPKSQCEASFTAILGKYKTETKQHCKRALLHLARCFVPYVNSDSIGELIKIVTPLIKSAKDKKEQKAAYRVLEQTVMCDLLFFPHSPGVSSALIAPAHDPVAVKSWSSVVTAALLRALELDAEQSIKWTWEWCSVALKYWRSDNVQVLLAMEESVSSVLTAVYDLVTVETSSQYETAVRRIMQQLELGLSYQCQGAWPCIFRLLGQCFSELGLYYAPTMIPALKHLCELMANNSLASVGELEKAIGKAVQGLGVEAVVCSAPFDITGDITKDEKNLWLLPLLRKFVKGSRLIFFKDNFVPLAEKCFNVRAKLESEPEPNARLVTLYKTVEYQIWAMLPSFACEAVDVEAAQTNRAFAKLVCRLIEHSESSRIDAMAALRNMIAADGSSTGRIAKNSSNYLPALFNLFVREPKTSHNADKPDIIDPSHRLAALSTIIAYLKIVPKSQCEASFTAILGKYKTETKQHCKRALLHLARCFVPYVNSDSIGELIKIVTPLIKSAKDKKEQKAAYRVLEQVLSAGTEGAQEFINNELLALTNLLVTSVSKAANSSRAPRLRCAKAVLLAVSERAEVGTREEFLQRVVGESVMCCGRSNSTATRRAAFTVLAELPLSLKRIAQLDDDTTVRECMRLLSSGLLGPPSLCSNTIIAITAFTYQARETMPLDILVQNLSNMCHLLPSSSREIVQACLSFIKGVVTLYPVAVLGPSVSDIMKGIVSLTPDCARKFRLKTKSILARLMRKFGDDYITKLVPAKHETLLKRIRNLRKEASRARRAKETEDEAGEQKNDDAEELFSEKAPSTLEEILAEIDPDLNDEDDDTTPSKRSENRRQSKPTTAWIAEEESDDEVLDLLGPEAASAIMTKKPREKKAVAAASKGDEDENGGFCIDPVTGKLIIVEDRKEKKSAHSTDHIAVDDMDDMLRMKDGAQTGKISNKKRNRPDSDADDDDVSIDLPLNKKPKKPKFDYGAEFRSKKGKGDMMRKGQTQKPYAYVPLSKSSLNRRYSKSGLSIQETSEVRRAVQVCGEGRKEGGSPGHKAAQKRQEKPRAVASHPAESLLQRMALDRHPRPTKIWRY
ncbi:putative domain NUC173 [Trinorchestia longiramus]|nr:putative domain NUC173 [Trinorchestia longiramus]